MVSKKIVNRLAGTNIPRTRKPSVTFRTNCLYNDSRCTPLAHRYALSRPQSQALIDAAFSFSIVFSHYACPPLLTPLALDVITFIYLESTYQEQPGSIDFSVGHC